MKKMRPTRRVPKVKAKAARKYQNQRLAKALVRTGAPPEKRGESYEAWFRGCQAEAKKNNEETKKGATGKRKQE